VGEETDRRIRAERLDETLQILTGLWTGEPFGFAGTHYRFEPMAFRPTPVQRPRIPIWVVGSWGSERSMSRAIRYDGLLPHAGDAGEFGPSLIAEMREWTAERRSIDDFDIVVEGTTQADDPVTAASEVRRWADAGATWWIESDWETLDPAAARRRIDAGPPDGRTGLAT
jgi:alkanesulfonate monooxygenase SsuD/methylene tetrahydromethanopterin reductase-like flavin-dependent oxidoreductase (luciferase family)